MATCPLCGAPDRGQGWLGSTSFAGSTFTYRACGRCRTQFVDPMPDDDVLASMYGPSYAVADGCEDDAAPAEERLVLELLQRRAPGTFLDHGCGDGELLARVAATGWRAIGCELDPAVVERLAARALEVHRPDALHRSLPAGSVDVLHLGDVVEHLPDPLATMQPLLELVRPGGTVISRGPLEANRSLFTAALWLGRTLRPRIASQPPYHVVVATADGQRRFFERLGLRETSFDVREVAWPAPATLGAARAGGARGLLLYGVRSVSRAVSAVAPGWGNRYVYVGTRG